MHRPREQRSPLGIFAIADLIDSEMAVKAGAVNCPISAALGVKVDCKFGFVFGCEFHLLIHSLSELVSVSIRPHQCHCYVADLGGAWPPVD
jgi:hypothetical protein